MAHTFPASALRLFFLAHSDRESHSGILSIPQAHQGHFCLVTLHVLFLLPGIFFSQMLFILGSFFFFFFGLSFLLLK